MFMSALFTNIQFSEAWVLSTKVLPNFLTPALLCGSGKEAMVFTLYNGFKFYGLFIHL